LIDKNRQQQINVDGVWSSSNYVHGCDDQTVYSRYKSDADLRSKETWFNSQVNAATLRPSWRPFPHAWSSNCHSDSEMLKYSTIQLLSTTTRP